jgi:hypothetical protein
MFSTLLASSGNVIAGGFTRNAKVSDEETDNEPNFSTLGHETSVFEYFDENAVFCSISAAFVADSISCFRTGQLELRSEKPLCCTPLSRN